jgi:hypothetical protein
MEEEGSMEDSEGVVATKPVLEVVDSKVSVEEEQHMQVVHEPAVVVVVQTLGRSALHVV